MNKYYAVRRGNNVGIFNSWPDCQTAIKGYANAEYKSFSTLEEANAYMNNRDLWDEIIVNDIQQGYIVAFCDGSFKSLSNKYSYGVVIIDSNKKEHDLYGVGSNTKYISSNNIIGELSAAINAMDWAVSNQYHKIKIYHDYEGVGKWILGEWKASKPVGKWYINVYQTKFEGLLDVKFQHVKGHSNNKFNDKADELANLALEDNKCVPIRGAHWFSLSHVQENDIQSICELIKEDYPDMQYNVSQSQNGNKYVVQFEGSKVVITCYQGRNRKVLVQGKHSMLFQMITSLICELTDVDKIEPILSNAYRIKVDKEKTDNIYQQRCSNLPANYPANIKSALKQTIVNLTYYIECDDYSMYVFPALRALEGHLKYLFKSVGINITNKFSQFDKNDDGRYYCTTAIADANIKAQIEECYNLYNSQRHTLFHFGDLMGQTDSTRIISQKAEADEIMLKCIDLICA